MIQLDKALAFDLETTGLDIFGDQPVSFALINAEADGFETAYQLVVPEVEISPEAQAKHGLDLDTLKRDGIQLREALKIIGNAIVAAGRDNVPLVGMNLYFDLTILDHQLRQCFGKGLAEAGWNGPIYDVWVVDLLIDRFRKGNRQLDSLCEHYRVPLDDAHNAASDAAASLLVARAQIGRYPWLRERDFNWLLSVQRRNHLARDSNYRDYATERGEAPRDPLCDWPIGRES